MGGAIVEGLLKSHYVDAESICVSDASADAVKRFADKGVNTTTDNCVAAKSGDMVIVVVKPWLVERVLLQVKDVMDYGRQQLVVVAAGIKGEQLKTWMQKDGQLPAMHLAIPNIAIAQLASMTFLVAVEAKAQHTEQVKALFDAMGQTLLTEEHLLGAGTTLASCGIAYAMRYVRAASEGGVELGFKADQAKDIVLQTMEGAVKLLQAIGLHPEAAIDLVTTPGGVTIKGLNEMEHAGFTSAVIRGLKAGAK
jgi:pyrroline-5-carboxylate reductase